MENYNKKKIYREKSWSTLLDLEKETEGERCISVMDCASNIRVVAVLDMPD